MEAPALLLGAALLVVELSEDCWEVLLSVVEGLEDDEREPVLADPEVVDCASDAVADEALVEDAVSLADEEDALLALLLDVEVGSEEAVVELVGVAVPESVDELTLLEASLDGDAEPTDPVAEVVEVVVSALVVELPLLAASLDDVPEPDGAEAVIVELI